MPGGVVLSIAILPGSNEERKNAKQTREVCEFRLQLQSGGGQQVL
jgi:hypothetical protein